MILDHGKVLYDGVITDLNHEFESDWSLLVTFAEEYENVDLPGLATAQRESLRAVYTFDHRKVAASDLIQQLLPRFRIADLEVRRPSLEDTIRRIYDERLLLPVKPVGEPD
jgi:ABC-2 type transport system ATP-binding protein